MHWSARTYGVHACTGLHHVCAHVCALFTYGVLNSVGLRVGLINIKSPAVTHTYLQSFIFQACYLLSPAPATAGLFYKPQINI